VTCPSIEICSMPAILSRCCRLTPNASGRAEIHGRHRLRHFHSDWRRGHRHHSSLGSDALAVGDRLFHSRNGRVSEFPSHTLHFGTIGRNGEMMRPSHVGGHAAPRTYTKKIPWRSIAMGGSVDGPQDPCACLQNGAALRKPGNLPSGPSSTAS